MSLTDRAGLATVTLSAIVAACGVSKGTASAWRAGRYVPPLRHWEALAELAGVTVDAVIGYGTDELDETLAGTPLGVERASNYA